MWTGNCRRRSCVVENSLFVDLWHPALLWIEAGYGILVLGLEVKAFLCR